MFIRNSFFRKFSAVFLLLIFLTQILGPSVANALTSGPHQPEYTSYEEPGSTDLVNLLTGDFNYSVPLLEIPGPEGGVSVPLSYHSGVGVDQQASWVGLGWSLNVGAIARGVVEYPDDASGESYEIHRSNANIARGWTSNIPGVGQIGWDSNEGHYGTISILGLVGASYKNGGLTGGNLVGVHFSSKKVTVDPAQLVAAVMTIATLGAGGVASSAGNTLGQEVAKQAAIQIAIEAASTLVFGVGAPDFNIGGYWKLSDRKEKKLFHTNYWVWLDQTRYENMYGTLYLGAMNNFTHPSALMPNLKDASGNPVDPMVYVEPKDINDEGATSDISYSWNGEPYHTSQQPTNLAKDNYSVMGNGISGSMAPYRLDVGSVAMPRQMNSTHIKYAVARHIHPDDYKVQFKYEGMPSNTYTHHAGGTRDANGESQINLNHPQLGITTSYYSSDPESNDRLIYDTSNDPSLPEHFTSGSTNVPVEQNRTGLTNKALAQARHVQWFSNDEIINDDDISATGFMDCMPKGERQSMVQDFGGEIRISISSSTISTNRIWVGKRNAKYFAIGQTVKLNGTVSCSNNIIGQWTTQYMSNFTAQVTGINGAHLQLDQMPCETTYHKFKFASLKTDIQRPVPLTTIGGYVITKEDGRKYHYSLPVYEWGNITYMQDVNDSDDITEMSRLDPFPSTWLLTAITGPDFYDRNENGMVDDTDWGHWIRFDYGKFSSTYPWRSPYKGMRLSSDGGTYSYTKGMREQYYLNNIRTRTHTALFIKDLRTDGKSSYTTASNGISSSLLLDEIILLKNEDLFELNETGLIKNNGNSGYSLLSNSDSFDEIWDKKDINAQKRSDIDAKALKKIKLNYSYNLAQNTPNSFDDVPYENQGSFPGKLTLESLSFLGNNNFKVLPDYYFEYVNNANYDEAKWDGWGYYNSAGTSHHQSHKASNLDADGYAWNLNRIITPMGSTIEVDYERDTYSSISGHPVTESHYFSDKNWDDGISVGNPNAFSVGENITLDFTVNYSCGSEGFIEPYKVQTRVTSKNYDRIYIEQTPPFVSCMDESQPVINSVYGYAIKTINRKGGDIRVSKITTSNNYDFSASVRYLYDKGVVAKEPDYIKQKDYDFYQYYDFPSTPVVYGKVTVLNGLLTNIADYDVKQVYEFITPHHTMVSNEFDGPAMELVKLRAEWDGTVFDEPKLYQDYFTKGIHKININTSRIGQLDKITTYDNADNIVATTDMIFAEEIANNENLEYQGVFTEGTLQAEKLREGRTTYHRLFRTTKITHPSFPVKVITTHNNRESISENIEFDFLTGAPVKVLSLEPNGINILTETIPAYKVYPEMGAIAENPGINRNMLGQSAATYTYRVDENLAVMGLLSASATVWNNDWENYRNLESGEYTSGENATAVWRVQSTYGYEGSGDELNTDGSLLWNDSKKFNHADPTLLSTWRINGTINRYDNFSMPVESYDEDTLYNAVKFDALKKNKVAEASLAKYTEFTFSGAENKPITSGEKVFLDGETFIDDINMIKDIRNHPGTKSHTGTKSLELTTLGSKGFQYIVNTTQENFDINQKYISMVWVNKDQSEDVKLYYKYTVGTITVTKEDGNVLKHAGEWTRLSQQIALPQGVTNLEVGVVKKSSSEAAFIDDFKFQPLMASVTSYIQDDKGALTYVLNDENLFSRSKYNDGGQLIATYAERFDTDKLVLGERKIAESKADYANLPKNEMDVNFAYLPNDFTFTATPLYGKPPYLIKWYLNHQLYKEEITDEQSNLIYRQNENCGYQITCKVMDGYGALEEHAWESSRNFFERSGSQYSGGIAEMSVMGGSMPYTYTWKAINDQEQIVEQHSTTVSETSNIWQPFIQVGEPQCYRITCSVVDNCGQVLNQAIFNSFENIIISKQFWPETGSGDQEYTFNVGIQTCATYTSNWSIKKLGTTGGMLNIPPGSYDDNSLQYTFASCGNYEVKYTAVINGELYSESGLILIDDTCL